MEESFRRAQEEAFDSSVNKLITYKQDSFETDIISPVHANMNFNFTATVTPMNCSLAAKFEATSSYN